MNDLHNLKEPDSTPAIWADTRAAGFTMASEPLPATYTGVQRRLTRLSGRSARAARAFENFLRPDERRLSPI